MMQSFELVLIIAEFEIRKRSILIRFLVSGTPHSSSCEDLGVRPQPESSP